MAAATTNNIQQCGNNSGLRYKDKVVVITGGARGIGEGCVKVFVKNGAKVAFCDIRVAEGTKLEAEMNKTGPGEAFFKSADVEDEKAIEEFVDEVVKKYSRIDCLINNAGQHPPRTKIEDITAEDFMQLIRINVLGYILMSKRCLPHLRKVKGSIINNTSLVIKIGQRQAIPYVATKGAIDAMSKAMAIDEAANGVRVNTFCPGNIWTPMWEKNVELEGEGKADMIEGGKNSQLMGRMGTPEEMGMVCLFLAADATYCTGMSLTASGGAELDFGNKNQTIPKASIYH